MKVVNDGYVFCKIMFCVSSSYNNSSHNPKIAGLYSLCTYFMETVSLGKVYTPEALNMYGNSFLEARGKIMTTVFERIIHIFGANYTNIYV